MLGNWKRIPRGLRFLLHASLVAGTLTWSQETGLGLRFQQAAALQQSGKIDLAIQEYRLILLEDPRNTDAYLAIAQIRTQEKKWSQAEESYRQALNINPNHIAAMQGLARVLEAQGNHLRALAEWRKVEQLSEGEERTQATKQVERLRGVTEPAPAPPARPQGEERYKTPLFQQGLQLLRAGKREESLEIWRRVLRQDRGNPGAYYYAGVARYDMNDLERAHFNFNRSFDYPNLGHNAHFYLGRIYEKKEEPDKAIEQYKRYIDKTQSRQGIEEARGHIARLERQLLSQSGTWVLGDDWNPVPDILEPLGSERIFFVVHQEEGRGSEDLKKALARVRAHGFNQALDQIKTVSLRYPNTPNALASEYNVIALYRHLGLDDHVQNMASALIRRAPPEPYFSGANYLLALALSSMGDFSRAETVFGEIHTGGALVPPQSELLALGAHISQNLSDSKSGTSRLLKAIQSESSSRRKAELRMELARLYFAQKQRGSARRALDEVLRECKKETWEVCRKAHYEIADMEYRNRNWKSALDHYGQAIQIFSDTTDAPWGFYQIANIHRNQKRYDQAILYYDSLSQKFPRSYWADQARWKRDDTIWQKEYEEVLR